MFSIYRREIGSFFSSLSGYVVIFVYLMINSLFMWILPGEWNILDSGYASLETLFIISPWVFLFLVPAVTMRMIAEEKRSGTLELLLSRPVNERHIIYAKFLASLTLVLLALLPCIIYYISVCVLGETPGNIDKGGTIGAFIGLFFLAGVYAAIGIFASSLSSNQVIAFIIAVISGFLVFVGFESFALLPGLQKIDEFVVRLGINEHYKSISRGVIDLRDIIYFIVAAGIFTEGAGLLIKARKWRWSSEENEGDNKSRSFRDISSYITLVIVALIFSFLSSLISLRLDITSDKRYTLSEQTVDILSELEDDIYFQVFLDGDMPVGLKKLKRSVRAILEEFRMRSNRKVDFLFINPSEAANEEERQSYYMSLVNRGLLPVNIMDDDEEGGRSEKMLFPGMILSYNGIEMPLNFLKNNPSLPAEHNLSNSIEGLEYEMIQTISTIVSDTVYKVAFIEGHGELEEIDVADITLELAKYFTVDRGVISGQAGILDSYSAIIIAKPQLKFSEEDKFVIDQYIMNGGKVLWLIDELMVNADSLAMGGTLALYEPLNIEDQLFKYGVRINPVLIQDTECMIIPVRASLYEDQQIIPVPWIYYPLLYPSVLSPITRNINKVKGEFVNYIDTVSNNPDVKKQTLLATSPSSRFVSPPLLIRLEDYKNFPSENLFTRSFLPVAVLLEGKFPSLYANRMIRPSGESIIKESRQTRMIVVADGDIIRNEVSIIGNRLAPLRLGTDRYSGQTFGNKDFLVNCLNYLVDDKEIISLRSREMKLRLLDTDRVKENKVLWKLINTLLPVLLLLIAGLLISVVRRKKFAL